MQRVARAKAACFRRVKPILDGRECSGPRQEHAYQHARVNLRCMRFCSQIYASTRSASPLKPAGSKTEGNLRNKMGKLTKRRILCRMFCEGSRCNYQNNTTASGNNFTIAKNYVYVRLSRDASDTTLGRKSYPPQVQNIMILCGASPRASRGPQRQLEFATDTNVINTILRTPRTHNQYSETTTKKIIIAFKLPADFAARLLCICKLLNNKTSCV